MSNSERGRLVLEDGTSFEGVSFGFPKSVAGEVVFNTGMVGYPEALTDPSYRGQVLVLTSPLVGNYGVPDRWTEDLSRNFESGRLQITALIVADASLDYSHWSAARSLAQWLKDEQVPALTGVDTRALTRWLREKGTAPGKIVIGGEEVDFYDPNAENLVSAVSVQEPVVYSAGKKCVILVDCGCKNSIIRNLLERNLTVIRVPWNFDFFSENYDGIVISNGPGDPKICDIAILHIEKALQGNIPIFGICLGHQILALASGADTFKLKFGHRSQNQPCTEVGTRRCHITSQNHGYAVKQDTLSDHWVPWFVNSNDATNEGLRHRFKPFMSVQFHPEAAPGPMDTQDLFDKFATLL